MPVQVSYPGIYVQENPSGSRTVTGVSTASTAFVDFFARGPVSDATDANAVQIQSFRDFTRTFGGLNRQSEASYAIYQYFNNGGSTAWVVRAISSDPANQAAVSTVTIGVNPPSRESTLDAATTAANNAKTAAQNADTAAQSAQNATNQDLVNDINTVVTSTQEAAQQTLLAAQAATQASQQLNAASTVAAASAGPLADSGKSAAQAAAKAADDASTAAANAQAEASKAKALADQLDPANAGSSGQPLTGDALTQALAEVQPQINATVQAAEAAATAAQTAVAKASDAQITATEISQGIGGPSLVFTAANPGVWGNNLRVGVVLQNGGPNFKILVQEVTKTNGVVNVVNSESYQNLSLDETSSRYAPTAVNAASSLIRIAYQGVVVQGSAPQQIDQTTTEPAIPQLDSTTGNYFLPMSGGEDGGLPSATDIQNAMGALNYIAPAVYNILCLPITTKYSSDEASVLINAGLQACAQSMAFMILDPPSSVKTVGDVTTWSSPYRNAINISGAVYFPRLTISDPLNEYRPREVGPSGTVAGVYARTDVARGVWKAPAGIQAVIQSANLVAKLTDTDSGTLNPLGINVLRSFPVYGNIVWGARTLAGADLLESDFKYIPVRRLTSYIEQSLVSNLKWVVFEPNDDATWAQIRQQVGSFLAGLYAQGAFFGTTPDKAYFVQCDGTTTTQTDIDNGIVNIIVGFAPLKPAEFVILQIEQIAGATA